ncbi:hypothetical protein H2200_013362 [Cladophialophora chaetospira]|uniref:Uncharacterized protein n=1 Tax=Cladophialophora chaetospira TaxID=386627 RepID=A0AA39CBD8_9EURO|nr:hypothetical protein H2200_013362 [Cladophialophora chaetospira]
MPDEMPPEKHTHPPPPMDPFPTYQTPYPRSNKDDEQNPFIQFRRFADDQVSSLFSGFPHFFGLSPSSSAASGTDHWKREVEDIMRQRQEWEEGFRKQFEQEMEEMRQQLEKSKTEAWKSMEDAWKQHSIPQPAQEEPTTPTPSPWWTRGNAAKCPALNGKESQKNASKCPALYDEKGQPRTELDAYNALQDDSNKQVQVFQAPAPEEPKKPVRSLLPALGWDGKQKQKLWRDAAASPEEPAVKREKPLGRPTTYSLWGARRMQPFDNANETIPWLMLSPYSPIYLCNPAQSRLFKVKIQESAGAPLQISSTRFFERWYTDIDAKMATHKPWADAFEDLLSLQQTGHMVERDNWNTWRTPRTWIHDMASRGSLGDRWGFNDEGLLVKRADSIIPASNTPTTNKDDRCSRWRKNRECRRRDSTKAAPTPPGAPAEEENILVDKVTEALAPFPLFGSIISAADAIVSAIDQAAQNENQSQAPAELEGDVPSSVAEGPTTTKDQTSTSSSGYSASSSSSSYAYDSSVPTNTNSVTSTLTTTTTRTLPDGSVETKRVLKRRFADGSEESDERVEVRNPSSDFRTINNSPAALATSPTEKKDKHTQTQSSPDEVLQRQKLEDAWNQIRSNEVSKQQTKDADELNQRGRARQESERQRREELVEQQQQARHPRQIAFVSTIEPHSEAQQPQLQQESRIEQQQQQQQSGDKRRGSGWFWN